MSKKGYGANTIIFDDQGRILLVKHTYGRKSWHLPGGGAEANESVVETAVRETYEETGLQVVATHITGIYYDPGQDFLILVFLCRSSNGRFEPLCPDLRKISECAFWPLDALPKPINDFTIRRINDALSGVRLPLPIEIPPRQWLVE